MLLACYTALFVLVATTSFCLFMLPPPHYYLPQRLVAAGCLAAGILSILRANALLHRAPLDARVVGYGAFAVVLFLSAGVRFFFVGFIGGWAVCGYIL